MHDGVYIQWSKWDTLFVNLIQWFIFQTEAMRLSGVNKKIYINGLKALESMLGLEEETTIKDLAITFGCTGATDLATQVLQS